MIQPHLRFLEQTQCEQIHQLKRTGAPFVFGSGLHHLDMRTSISVYGAPEFQLARLGVADMVRFYGLPSWGYAGHSDSCGNASAGFSDRGGRLHPGPVGQTRLRPVE